MGDVEPGQVWADCDPREAGRTVRVDQVSAVAVVVTVLTSAKPDGRTGHRSTVSRGGFPKRYRLVEAAVSDLDAAIRAEVRVYRSSEVPGMDLVVSLLDEVRKWETDAEGNYSPVGAAFADAVRRVVARDLGVGQ